jgi:hypothetical protein
VNVSSTSIWTCWTSLVTRVMSDGAPNWPTSRVEKRCTRLKRPARTSRPTAMAVRAPKNTAAICAAICSSVMPSIPPPTRMM